jgi:AraC-like DNA-binding protein/putative methionine-R-sulfoxide reductase with GAF domain
MNLTGITIHDRFRLIKRISDGLTGSIYLAHCIEKNENPVMVKILKDDIISKKAEDLIRYRHELGIVSRLNHANVVRILDYGEVFELQFIVFEYFQGTTLFEILKKQNISTERILDVIIQICRALDCIHQNGVIQRDLNPENVLIHNDSGSAGDTVKLADSGAAHIIEFSEVMAKSKDIPDPINYFSPEQSGLIKRHVDERSDMYSLGVMFYQLLTGKLPFTADESFLFTRQNAEERPELPGRLNPAVPPILDRIVLKLLETEPENRYQSAKGLLHDLDRFESGDREFMLGLNDESIKLSYRTKLIGRNDEFTKLKKLFEGTREGRGRVCLISGEAGIGKTRLIEELHDYVCSQNAIFIQGKSFYGDNKEPYGLLKDALGGYVAIFNRYSDKKKKEVRDSLRTSVGLFGEIIFKLNPQLKEILGECPSLVSLSPKAEDQRFLSIISQFFINLSAIENGLVLIIEDLQWSSEWTLTLLNSIADSVSKSSLLVIGTYRHNEITEKHALMKFISDAKHKGDSLVEINIRNFDAITVNNFISGILCENEIKVRDISDFIHRKSKGNPLFAIEILKQLVNEKALYYENNKWNIDDVLLRQSVIPPTIIDILIKRTSLLNQKDAMVLAYAAVIGRSFEIGLLYHLLGEFNKTELVRIIDTCIQLQLLDRDNRAENRFSFVHDRIQEAFYINIDADTRKNMHAKVAATLEEINRNDKGEVLFELAHHYIESGNKDKSLEFAYPASLKAAQNFAHDDALRYFTIAVELLTQKIARGDESMRPQWITAKDKMARIYLRIGRYDEAVEIFNQLLPFERDEISKALVLSNISSAYFKKGDWDKCEKYSGIGIKLLGGELPVTTKSVVASLVEELLVHGLHVMFPEIFIAKSPNPKANKKIVQGIFYESLINMYVLSGRLKYARAVLKILNQVESYLGRGQAVTKVLYAYGTLLMSLSRYKAALRYFAKSLQISIEMNDHFNIGRTYQLIGYCHEWAGEYGKTIENFKKAIDVFTKIGDSNQIGFTLNGLATSYLQIEDFYNAKATSDKFFEIADKSNDNYQICNALIFKTLYNLEIGKYDSAETYALRAYNLSFEGKIWMPYCIINILLGSIYKYKNDINKAVAHIEEAKELYEKHKFLKYYTIFLYTVLTDVYISEYVSKKNMTEKEKISRLRRINKSCNMALNKTRNWNRYYNQSIIVSAKYYALIDKNKKARKLFNDGIDYFSKHGFKLEMAKGLFEYGVFLSQIGDTNESRKSLESSYQIFEEIGIDSHAERLRTMLGIKGDIADSNSMRRFIHNKRLSSIDKLSAAINQISDSNELFNRVIAHAVEITCAQKGYLFIENGSDELDLKATTSMVDSREITCSPEIVENVYNNNYAINSISSVEDVENFDGQSITLHRLKSILCMPVRIKDSVIGVCYLENELSNGQFNEEDSTLLAAFLSRVSAAINNVYINNQSVINKNDDQWIITPSIEDKMIQAIAYIKDNYRFNIAREGLANMLDINSDNLGRYFRMYTGQKIGDYVNRLRVEEAAKKLRETNETVINIAFSVGFENISTFNKVFIKYIKTTPTNYRKLVSDISPIQPSA